jgi:hypothetical protein
MGYLMSLLHSYSCYLPLNTIFVENLHNKNKARAARSISENSISIIFIGRLYLTLFGAIKVGIDNNKPI